MKEEAHKILKMAVDEYREQLLGSRQTCLGILRDFGGREHPEVNLLADAVEERIPDRLLQSQPITQDIIDSLAENFAATKFLDAHASEFAVSSWADVLGLYQLPSAVFTNVVQAAEPATAAASVSEREWYYQDAGNTTGPVAESQLEYLALNKKIYADTLVWAEGMNEWAACSIYFPQASMPQPIQSNNTYYQPQTSSIPNQLSPVKNMTWTTILWSFKGRIPRRTYWAATGITLGIFWFLMALTESSPNSDFLSILFGLYCLPFIWSSLAIQTKRWHDRGKSGAMALINLIPYVGMIWTFAECGCQRGSEGDNKYGTDPT